MSLSSFPVGQLILPQGAAGRKRDRCRTFCR